MEIPQEEIANAVEGATAAVNASSIEEEDEDDTRTVAEPEMELDEDVHMDDEAQPEAEDLDQDPEEVSSRQPVLVNDSEFYMDQALIHAKMSMHVSMYVHIDSAFSGDFNTGISRYMAFMAINHMHKNWRGNTKWLEIPLARMQELFRQQKRYDVLGSWRDDLSHIDETTGISRNVTDEEVIAYGRSLNDHEDPTGRHLLNKFQTNQLIAKLMRGAIHLGYRRVEPIYHMRDGQTEDTPQMHSSCAAVLSRLLSQVAGYRQYTLLATRDNNTPSNVLCIDAFGLGMVIGLEKCVQQLLTVMVDLDIQTQAKFTARLTHSRQHGQPHHGNALQHLPRGGYLPAGQTSILDQPVTPEEAEAAREIRAKARAKAKAKAKRPPEPKDPPPQQDRWQRHGRYDQWHEHSSGSQHYQGQRRWSNDRGDG